MNPIDLRSKLLAAREAPDFIEEAELITISLKEEGAGLESVRVILEFMEENPAIDFGSPGSLVHFIEKFYGRGYEAELIASINRKPTSHTVWMLNRIINGTKEAVDRERLIDILRMAESHPASDTEARQQAADFLKRLSL